MATLVFTAAGTALGGPVGGFIGGVIGGIIDSQFVFPALFDSDSSISISGPRLNDLKLQSGSEGAPVAYCIGNRCRLAGTVIFMTDLVETIVVTEEEQDSGGKGGSGSAVTTTSTTYQYSASIAIGVCEGVIDSINKIWADGKKFSVTSSTPGQPGSTVQFTDAAGSEFTIIAPSLVSPFVYGPARITSSTHDMELFQSGGTVTFSNFTNGVNNGAFQVVATGDLGGGTTYMDFTDFIFATPPVAETSPIGADVLQIISPFIPAADFVRTYLGTTSQAKDPMLQAELTDANTTAFRGLAYVTIEGLQLANYGNRIPQFNFRVATDSSAVTIGEAISRICARAGLSSGQYDVTALASTEVKGYVISGPKNMAAVLEPLMLAYDLGVRDRNGTLVFFPKGSESTLTLNSDHLAAHVEGSEIPPEIVLGDRVGFDLPSQVNITFINTSNELNQGSFSERRRDAVTDVIEDIDLPLTLGTGLAKKIARRRLWAPWINRQLADLILPPSYIIAEEGDIVPAIVAGETYSVRIKNLNRGVNWINEIEGVVEKITDYAYDEDDEDGPGDDDTIYYAPHVTLLVFNFRPLQDSDATIPVHYYAVAATDSSASWLGASLHCSPDDTAYVLVGGISSEAMIVTANGTLGDTTNPYQIDRLNTLNVTPMHGTPTTATELDWLNGSNRLLLFTSAGNAELIGFRDVTDEGDGTYTLSHLMRGLRNTEEETANHSSGMLGVVLTAGTVNSRSITIADDGVSKYFKAPAVGHDTDDVGSYNHPQAVDTLRPFAPSHAGGGRDGSDNLDVTWLRRTRLIHRLIAGLTFPLIEPTEKYEVDLLTTPGGAVSATYSVTGALTLQIPAAALVTAGYAVTDPVDVNIYQVSDAIGRGWKLGATINVNN